MCECGAPIQYKRAKQCRPCYDRARYLPLITAAVPTTKPCSYDAAHQRVEYWRGRACERVCTCGAPASEWSYRNHSSYEMTGRRRKRYPNGSYGWINSKWSTNVCDYDALCRDCHELRDSKVFLKSTLPSPGRAPQILSPNGHREAL